MLYGIRAIADYLIILAFLLLLLLLGMVHTDVPVLFIHLLPATAVYYWSLMRADFLFSSHVFVIGCVQDLLTGAPIGLHAVIYLAIRMAAFTQYRVFLRRSLVILWAAFSALMAVTLAGVAIIASIHHYVSLAGLLVSWIVLSGSFLLLVPIMAWLNTLLAYSFGR